jgi:alpha-L-rhamnosidase
LASGQPDLWDSGRVESDQSVHVAYAGRALRSRECVHWRVRTWDADDQPTAWSSPQVFEMGLLKRSDWKARWIGLGMGKPPSIYVPSPYLRKRFTVAGDVVQARLYVSALGLFEAYVSGQRIGDDLLAPGWTDFRKRVKYHTYDVTSLIKAGANVIGAILGTGWYCGGVNNATEPIYGDRPRLLAQLEVVGSNGKRQMVVSDDSWRGTSDGPIRSSDLMQGERYEARLEMTRWNADDFDDSTWAAVDVEPLGGARLVAAQGPPVRITQELKARTVNPGLTPDTFIFDLGQNMVGVVRLHVTGAGGTTVTIRHGEMLNPDGSLYTENLRSAKATDQYTLRGDPAGEVYQPRFTFHGFRYVELTGCSGMPTTDAVTGVVLHSDTPMFSTTFSMAAAMS